jgi:hypothetical protein
MCRTPFVVSLSNHERPFDRLRANGENPIFVTMTVRIIRRACYSAVCLRGVSTIIITADISEENEVQDRKGEKIWLV